MKARFAVIPAGSADVAEGAIRGAVAEVLGALEASPVGHYLAECRNDFRGALLDVDSPEQGYLEALLILAKDHELAVYDIDLDRLYDPTGSIDVDVLVPGVRVPFLTRELLTDLVSHPDWPDPEAPYVIVERGEKDFIQAWRGDDGVYQVEYREGGPESHFAVHTDDAALIVRTMWAWATNDESWRIALDWTCVEIAEDDGVEQGSAEFRSRYVSLQSEHLADGSWLTVDARLDADGTLHITGQDLGPVTRMMSDDGEYEWAYSVEPDDLPALVVALGGTPAADIIDVLEQRWSGSNASELGTALRASGIRYGFWSYP